MEFAVDRTDHQVRDAELDAIRERARRRFPWLIATCAVAGGIGGALSTSLFDDSADLGKGHPSATGVVAGVAVVVVGLAVLAWIVRRSRRGRGMLTAPLLAGLPRGERRAVARAIRRAAPSENPTLRAVEVDTADRLVIQRKLTAAMYAALLVLDLIEAIFVVHGRSARVAFGVAAVIFAGALVAQQYRVRRARAYLAVGRRYPSPIRPDTIEA
jgi:hypothetical protein